MAFFGGAPCWGKGKRLCFFWFFGAAEEMRPLFPPLYTVMRTSLLIDTTHCDVPRVHLPAPTTAQTLKKIEEGNYTERPHPFLSMWPAEWWLEPKQSRKTAPDDWRGHRQVCVGKDYKFRKSEEEARVRIETDLKLTSGRAKEACPLPAITPSVALLIIS